MSECRIFSPTSGKCLVPNVGGTDEAERSRVKQDFYAGVRLVVDANHNEVRGFIPANRKADEAFFAVVQIEKSSTPIDIFRSAVEEEFENRSGWTIRYDTPEGRLLRNLSRTAPDSEYQQGGVETRESISADDPVRLGVANLEVAAKLLQKVYRCDKIDTTTVVALSDVDHIAYDRLYVQQEQETDILDFEATESSLRSERNDEAGLIDWLSTHR